MAVILICLLLLAISSLIFGGRMDKAVDSREPPYLWPTIPFVGHILGILRRGPDYLIEICPENHSEIYTIPFLTKRVILVTGPEEVDAIRKPGIVNRNKLSLSSPVAIALRKVFGVSASCQAKFTPNAESLTEGSLKRAMDRLFKTLTSPERLKDFRSSLYKELVEKFRSTALEEKVPIWKPLNDWFRRAMILRIFGPKIRPAFVDRLQYFENGMEKLMLPFSSVFARSELKLREELVEALREYIQGEHFIEGSKFIREFIATCESEDLGLQDTSRLCLLVTIAFVGNLSNVGSWVTWWAASCPKRLSLIRKEINPCVADAGVIKAADDPQLEFSNQTNDCPVLESTLKETLRKTQESFTFRKVMKPLEIATASGQRYLLPENSLVVMAPRKNMTSEKIWDQPDDFRPSRFENHKLLAVQRHSGYTAARLDSTHETDKRDQTHSQEMTKDQELSFQPFGGGKGLCEGRFLAWFGIPVFVKLFVENFDIIFDSEEDKNTLVPTSRCMKFSNEPEKDILAVLRRREGADVTAPRGHAEG